MGIAVAVASGKGGVGKTSLVAGLSACLAVMGKRVLCIDADIGLRNLDIVLGLSDKTALDFGDVLKGNASLEKAIVRHNTIENLSLLNAPFELSGNVESEFQDLVAQAAQTFDFCFIDCPAGLGGIFRMVASAVNNAVLVTTLDTTSLRDAGRGAILLDELGVKNTWLVVNRVRPRLVARADAPNVDDAIDMVSAPLLGIIPEDERVISSSNHAQSIIFNTSDGAALAYYNIARRIIGESVPLMRTKRR